jgi:hypothetical protein
MYHLEPRAEGAASSQFLVRTANFFLSRSAASGGVPRTVEAKATKPLTSDMPICLPPALTANLETIGEPLAVMAEYRTTARGGISAARCSRPSDASLRQMGACGALTCSSHYLPPRAPALPLIVPAQLGHVFLDLPLELGEGFLDAQPHVGAEPGGVEGAGW